MLPSPIPIPIPTRCFGLPRVWSGVPVSDWGRAFFLPPPPDTKLRKRFFSISSHFSCLLMKASSDRSSCWEKVGSCKVSTHTTFSLPVSSDNPSTNTSTTTSILNTPQLHWNLPLQKPPNSGYLSVWTQVPTQLQSVKRTHSLAPKLYQATQYCGHNTDKRSAIHQTHSQTAKAVCKQALTFRYTT